MNELARLETWKTDNHKTDKNYSERLMIGVQCVAGLEGTFELTREYVKERKAFGKGN